MSPDTTNHDPIIDNPPASTIPDSSVRLMEAWPHQDGRFAWSWNMQPLMVSRYFWPGVLVLAAAVAHAQTQSPGTAAKPADPPAASDQQELTGRAAWAKVVGNTLVGTVEGRPFAEYYGRDGVA